jgi:nucleoside phosphorylase
MSTHVPADLEFRKELAQTLLSANLTANDLVNQPDLAGTILRAAAVPARHLDIPFPDKRPVPVSAGSVDINSPLPRADVFIITWTADETDALASVFTPGFSRDNWHRYRHNFDTADFKPKIRSGAPAQKVNRLGSWMMTKVGSKSVIVFKSELHLNQDSISTGSGTATLPVKALFKQVIQEVKPELVLTIGTAGGVFENHDLGDVVVTRAAKFRLSDEFKNEPFNGQTFKSNWTIPTARFADAEVLMGRFANNLIEPALGPPSKHFPWTGGLITPRTNVPGIILEGRDMPAFHPILTTDYFEFGTSKNHLDHDGCAVEMGDAVLGLVAAELGSAAPHWAVVRNLSDPQINGDLPTRPAFPRDLDMQAHWAVWYYQSYGYWTSVMGALATWGIVAGL